MKSSLLRGCIVLGLLGTLAITQESVEPRRLPALPESSKPSAALTPLEFMAGRWLAVNPNGTLNEEHWTSPRGASMVGTFRQVRRDGRPAFVEVSLMTVEGDKVRLRLRHLHSGLEVPESRAEPDDFFLQKVERNRAEFAGVGRAAPVTVIYRLADRNRLISEVRFDPSTNQRGYTIYYFREGSREARPQ